MPTHIPLKKYYYYYAIIFYVLINLIAGYGITLFVNIQEVYRNLVLPNWAPATWVFGVVWTLNNILVLIGNIWTLNAEYSSERTMLIRLQIISWINYAVFQWLSFGTGIPSLYFWPSFSMLCLTGVSMYYAYRLDTRDKKFWDTVKEGKSIMLTFSTLIVWLAVASTLGLYIMMHN
jgi:tryptophan-rich sensory protein